MRSMGLCAVGCCTRGLISVSYVSLTVRSGRKCSLLRLHGLQLSAERREKSFISLFHICGIDLINPIQDLFYLDYTWIYPNAKTKNCQHHEECL